MPGQYSMAMYSDSLSSPKSKTLIVWMCVRRDTIRASATKRSTDSLSAVKSGRMSFKAIALPMRVCSTL